MLAFTLALFLQSAGMLLSFPGMPEGDSVSEPIRYRDSLFQQVSVDTHVYAERGGETLALDLYQPAGDDEMRRPLVLYVHGGGFSGGRRDGEAIRAWAAHLARRGYVVGSMSYQLTMQGRSFHCDQPAANKIRTFQVAAGDIRACTRWILERADSLRIASDRVILAGSSAGAEAILHAGFWSSEQLLAEAPALPGGFRYAGLISMAGALVDTSLITRATAIPIQLFHGSCDPLVPYATAAHHYCPDDTPGALLLHGGHSLAQRYRNLGAGFQLITICRGGHEWAGRPLTHSRQEILDFLYQDVLSGSRRQLHLAWERGEACSLGTQPPICGPVGP